MSKMKKLTEGEEGGGEEEGGGGGKRFSIVIQLSFQKSLISRDRRFTTIAQFAIDGRRPELSKTQHDEI